MHLQPQEMERMYKQLSQETSSILRGDCSKTLTSCLIQVHGQLMIRISGRQVLHSWSVEVSLLLSVLTVSQGRFEMGHVLCRAIKIK